MGLFDADDVAAHAETEALLRGFLADASERGARLHVTIRDDGRPSVEVETLRENIEKWSSAIIGLLITRGPGELAWLEKLCGSGTTKWVAWEQRRQAETR